MKSKILFTVILLFLFTTNSTSQLIFTSKSNFIPYWHFGSSYGAACGDINNDGFLDLFVCDYVGVNQFFLNSFGEKFMLATQAYHFDTSTNGYSPIWVDIENDGDLDLFVTRPQDFNQLFLNQNGVFVEVSFDRGFQNSRNSISSAWADFDNDGDLDCYIVNWYHPNEFYENRDGYFFDVAPDFGVDVSSAGRSALWFDYDNDGDQDLFVANSQNTKDFFFKNEKELFIEISGDIGLADSSSSIGVSAGDFNNDGFQDLYIACGWYEQDILYQNISGQRFNRIDAEMELSDSDANSDVSWLDYDNDGDLDIYVVNQKGQNRLYQNNETFFIDVADTVNLNDAGNGMSAVWGDFNRDGFLDVFLANYEHQHDYFYQNSGNANNWLIVKLTGTRSNAMAIGAKVWLYSDEKCLFREIHIAEGFASQGSLEIEFGLGSNTTIDSLKIFWPSGIQEKYYNLNVNEFITIEEGTNKPWPTLVQNRVTQSVPETFVLHAYPNPFFTRISFEINKSLQDDYILTIYNVEGRVVKTISQQNSDFQELAKINWNGQDEFSNPLPSGIYLAELRSGAFRAISKITLLK